MARSAPGRHYRKGITLAEFFRRFPDDSAAEAWFAKTRWPDGPRCPHCESSPQSAHKTMPYRCRAAAGDSAPAPARSKLGYQTWALAILLTTGLKGTSSLAEPRDHAEVGVAPGDRIRETCTSSGSPVR